MYSFTKKCVVAWNYTTLKLAFSFLTWFLGGVTILQSTCIKFNCATINFDTVFLQLPFVYHFLLQKQIIAYVCPCKAAYSKHNRVVEKWIEKKMGFCHNKFLFDFRFTDMILDHEHNIQCKTFCTFINKSIEALICYSLLGKFLKFSEIAKFITSFGPYMYMYIHVLLLSVTQW